VTAPISELEYWLNEPEGEHLEFKEAKNNFHFDKLLEYAAALANEGGGKIILGVTDKRPRQVVGTNAFSEPERTVAGLVDQLRLKVHAEVIEHPRGRVLVFHIPSRPLGMVIEVKGAHWMRAGETLRPMTQDELRRILLETGPDFSAEICPAATTDDLDRIAIERFIARWDKESGKNARPHATVQQRLEDAELLIDRGVTYAALILFGTRAALGRHLGQAEIVFEYRSSDASIPYQQREEFRQGFFGVLDDLWALINLRNEVQTYQEGLFVRQIPVFNERAVREAILNAVTHRDYRHAGSVFVRQFPRKLQIISPGGLPAGVTIENIIDKQSPRNRRVAEACARCHLVERSGQGLDLIYRNLIEEGKPIPDFTGTDPYQVSVTLHGEVQNPQFLRFLERVGQEQQALFETADLIVLDRLQREEPVAESLKPRLNHLLQEGIVERIGRGRGVRYILSKRFYSFLGRSGTYTRARGLDRNTHKELLLQHIRESEPAGAKMSDLQEVLKSLSRRQVQGLVSELREEGRVSLSGSNRGGRWHLKEAGNAPNPN
jgi:ATP-dependent DNA helicase RecG